MTGQEHCRYLHIQDIRLYIQQEICNQESRRFLNANYGDSVIVRVETVNEADTRACTRVICADKGGQSAGDRECAMLQRLHQENRKQESTMTDDNSVRPDVSEICQVF